MSIRSLYNLLRAFFLRAAFATWGCFILCILIARGVGALSHYGMVAYVEMYGDGTQARVLDIAHGLDYGLYNDVDCRVDWTADGRVLLAAGSSREQYRIIAIAPGDAAPTALSPGGAHDSAPAVSPDGEYFAYAANRSRENTIHIVHLATGESQAVATIPLTVTRIIWSPDGLYLAVTGVRDNRYADGYVIALDSLGGTRTALEPLPRATDAAWLPDSSAVWVQFRSERMELLIDALDVRTGERTRITPPEGAIGLPHWLPDGTAAYLTGVERRGISIYRTGENNPASILVTPIYSEISALSLSPDGRSAVFSARSINGGAVYDLLTPFDLQLAPVSGGTARIARAGYGEYVNNFSRFCALAWSR